jgi:hypothetical protein
VFEELNEHWNTSRLDALIGHREQCAALGQVLVDNLQVTNNREFMPKKLSGLLFYEIAVEHSKHFNNIIMMDMLIDDSKMVEPLIEKDDELLASAKTYIESFRSDSN